MAELEHLIADCRKLPSEIASASEAMVRYVSSLTGQEWVKGGNGRWRPASANYVTLKPQWKQARSLAITVRGNPDEFERSPILPLMPDQHGYSAFKLEHAGQIADAFSYIERARTLYDRGRTRQQTTPRTVG